MLPPAVTEMKLTLRQALMQKSAEAMTAVLPKAQVAKHQTNGYLLFGKSERPKVLGTDGLKLAPTETMKALASRWSNLGVEEKKKWKAEAKAQNDKAVGAGACCTTRQAATLPTRVPPVSLPWWRRLRLVGEAPATREGKCDRPSRVGGFRCSG